MFLCSVRLSKIKIFLVFAVLLVVGGLVVAFLTPKEETAPSVMPPAELFTVADDDAPVRFLEYFGWEVMKEPTESAEVLIPAQFDEVYLEYNALQKKQGMDLEPYCGKTAKRMVYLVTNYPEGRPNVYAHLLICDGKIIGGDIASSELAGFMHGFLFPQVN